MLVRLQAGRAVLANVESNINNTNNARGKHKPQPSLSTVAEPAIGVESEDNDHEVITSLCGVYGQSQLHCQLQSALCNNCCVHLWYEHARYYDMLADTSLQILVASRSAKTNMRAFAGI